MKTHIFPSSGDKTCSQTITSITVADMETRGYYQTSSFFNENQQGQDLHFGMY